MVETIYHRLRFLIPKYKSGFLTQENAGLLFGPLTVWLETDVTHLPVVNTTDGGKVEQRIQALYRVYKLYNDLVPTDAMLPYYIGIFIDLHIKARHFKTAKEMAVRKVLPEQLSITDVLNDETSGLGGDDVYSIWSSCVGVGQCKSFVPWLPLNPYEEILPRSKNRRAKSYPPNSEIIDPVLPRKRAPGSVHAMFGHCIKGSQEPRYIKRSITPWLISGDARYTNIVKRGILGAYRTARVIAPPELRYRTYEQFDARKFVDTTKPDIMARLIREYVFSASKHHTIAWSLLQSDAVFKTTYTLTCSAMDLYRRGETEAPVFPKIPSRRPTPIEIIDFLCDTFKIDDTTTPRSLALITRGGVSLRWFYVIARMQRGDLRIYSGALESIGVPPSDRKAIQEAVCATSTPAAREAIRSLKLSAVGLAKFKHYIYILVQGSRTGYKRTIQSPLPEPVHAVICRRCNSLLSHYALGQLKVGSCVLDPIASTVRCSVCFHQSFTCVDITTHVVFARAKNPKYMSVLSVCTGCNAPCAWHPRLQFRDRQYCFKCFHALAASSLITTCLCGRVVKHHSPKFVTESGHYILCKSHTWILRYEQGFSTDFYYALIAP